MSKSGTRSKQRSQSASQSSDPDSVKSRLHTLFNQIEKEFDIVVAENVALKDRIEALEEVLLQITSNPSALTPDGKQGSTPGRDSTGSMGGVGPGSGDPSGRAIQLQQKLSVASLKRDSMATATQLGQKIKSTYKLKASSRIFKTQSGSTSGRLLSKFEWHKDGVWFVAAIQRHNKTFIGTASADGTACVADISRPENGGSLSPIYTYTGHQGCSVNCIRFHPQYDLALTASGDGTSHIWKANLSGDGPSPKIQGISSTMSPGVEESEDQDMMYAGQEGHSVIKQPLLELTGHASVVISCDWVHTVDQCVTASWDRTANIYDLHTGDLVVQLAGHDQELTDVSTHPTAPLIVTSSHDTTFRLWDFRDVIHSVCVFQGHTDSVTSTRFLGADKVISGADDRVCKIWDLRNMRSPLTAIHVEAPINKIAVSNQINLIAIPLDNRYVRIYDTNGNRVCRLPRNHHERMVTCATWASSTTSSSSASASSSNPMTGTVHQLITSGFDRRVCVWGISTSDQKERN